MRNLYATSLQLVHIAGGDAFEIACERGMRWAWRVGGEAPDLSEQPSGNVGAGKQGEETVVSWVSLGSDSARSLEIQLRHPDSTDSTVRWEASVAITKVGATTTATVRLGLEATVYSLRPLRLSLRAPSLIPGLMQAPLRAYAGPMELESGARVLDATEARGLTKDALGAEGRALPILVVSSDVDTQVSNDLARGLAGLAQVIRARDRSADAALRVSLAPSGFTVPRGGLRLFWPGFGSEEQSERQPYWTAAQLRKGGRGGGTVVNQLMQMLGPISAVRVPADPGVLIARQESLRERQQLQREREQAQHERARHQREEAKRAKEEAQRLARGDEARFARKRLVEVESLLELAEKERDEADARSKASEEAELTALEEAVGYSERVESLEAEVSALQKNLETFQRFDGLEEGGKLEEDTLPESIDSWEEVAANLDDLEGPGFFITDRARACANGKSRYPDPNAIWQSLRGLERTGRAFNEMGADLGVRFDQFALEHGSITVALKDRTYDGHWFEFEGRSFSRLPHVKVDDAKPANEVGRIYFAIDKDGKRVIVDWFGTKPDRPETKRVAQASA